MKLPEHYKNLTIEQKRIVVLNLIDQYWNKEYQEIIDNLTDEQVEFLFRYYFTESREERDKMRNEMKKKHETALHNLKKLTDKLKKLNLEFAELLSKRADAEEFRRSFR